MFLAKKSDRLSESSQSLRANKSLESRYTQENPKVINGLHIIKDAFQHIKSTVLQISCKFLKMICKYFFSVKNDKTGADVYCLNDYLSLPCTIFQKMEFKTSILLALVGFVSVTSGNQKDCINNQHAMIKNLLRQISILKTRVYFSAYSDEEIINVR